MFHFHKWTNDSQGAVYCSVCRKFHGWKRGSIDIRQIEGGVEYIGWGYLLNGEQWKSDKERKIASNRGRYE